jgi:hypothetical protein
MMFTRQRETEKSDHRGTDAPREDEPQQLKECATFLELVLAAGTDVMATFLTDLAPHFKTVIHDDQPRDKTYDELRAELMRWAVSLHYREVEARDPAPAADTEVLTLEEARARLRSQRAS